MSEPDAADEIEAAGGDPACWAGLVCLECGSVISEGHRDGCSAVFHPADLGADARIRFAASSDVTPAASRKRCS